MSISEPFIRRPVATTLLMIGLFLAGIVAFRELAVSALPQVDYPTIVVSTYLPGASSQTMAESVTTPLERQFGQMPSLAQMTSVSSFGSSQITLVFALERNIDAAEQDVQAAINASANILPRTLPVPPTYSKSNPADAPVLTLAVSSPSLPLTQVNDVADSVLAQKISQVSGVGLVTLGGSQKPAVRVRVDPEALASTGLSIDNLRQAIVAANVNQAKGSIDGPRLDYTIAANDQLTSAEKFKPIVVAWVNGSPLRLRDVAEVADGVENAQLAAWANDQRAIILNVQRQPGANVIQVADRVKALLPQLSASLPQSIEVKVLSDRTETVRASVEDVEFTLVITIGLVVLVMFAFLRNVRATIIPSIAVPLSLVGTFGIMYLLGYSLNNLTLMALTISTGFVVDDAIVMIENIARYIEEGEAPMAAALKGSKQIGFTIVSLTVSLVAVLIPLLFMTGIVGRLFREFAVTLASAIVVSALLSLSLTAMMCAHLLKPEPKPEERGRLFRFSEAAFDWALEFYDRGLRIVLAHQKTTLFVTILTLAVTFGLAWIVPKGFFPQEDTGLVTAVTEAPPDVSFTRMMELQEAVATVVRQDPDVASVASFIGADGTNATANSGRLSITLKPREKRHADANEIIARLESKLAAIEGMSTFMQAVQDLQIDARPSRTPFQYTIEDADAKELAAWAPRFIEALRAEPMLRGVTSDIGAMGLGLDIAIDRDTASRLGVTAQAIDDVLYDAFGQRQISNIFTQLNLYRVVLEVKPDLQKDPSALNRIYVTGTGGAQIPLSSIVHMKQVPAPLSVNHQGQFPSVTISFDAARGGSLGDAVEAIHRVQAKLDLPPGLHGAFQGTAQAFRESLDSEPVLVLAAIITVYIVLGVLYESTIHPITILSTLPSAGVGALLALFVCRTDFTVIALIGIVLLIGIVKKNAIMMIDFALEAERDEHLTPFEAIHKACLLRFRPIMMTTMAALLGGVPLAIGTGTGSELRRPLGITIVGGLIVSQVLTLYTTPVIYLYMGKVGAWVTRVLKRNKDPESPAGAEAQ
ncbi:Cobalt-zinc-cadmium resistance protein CzcA [Labilithrix luteola]|uniref:Cobalt-zinc-cadmium resistance protein CzcA n=1 Tax=Labilithrix luteola TaxID=1391654 RepID=A0A0K1QD60_9BACT|nr:multidrug efflux RND transporter permease subunit [Labilithrix luteola]AKV03602.1 Cobalt-zinc-cadmium resistance protein CzcA [Labilithrix luteola]